jgi:histone-lysine N-methyltransferase SETMAR
LEASKSNLAKFQADEPKFLSQLIIQVETWVHHYDPMTKQESRMWLASRNQAPMMAKSMAPAGKVMASIWWDCEGVLMAKFFKSSQRLSGDDHAAQLRELREMIKVKRPGKLTKGVLILQDNAPIHKSRVAMAAADDCAFQLLPHPPYSPDLAPSNYFLFS